MTSLFLWAAASLAVGIVIGWLLGLVRGSREKATLQERIVVLESERRAAEEKTAWAEAAEQKLREAFQALAATSLQTNAELLLTRVREQLDSLLKQIRGDWQVQKEQVAGILQPVERGLKALDEQVQLLEKERKEAYGSLTQYLSELSRSQKELKEETGYLRTALTTSSAVRGHWGEVQLRRIVEMAGLLRHVDFEEQKAVEKGRPDMIVHLPNGAILPVDAKVSMRNYLAAVQTDQESVREERLKAHARAMRDHVKELAAREYWSQFDKTPEVVVMFVPNESCLSAAFVYDPDLIEFALASHVLIATPVTLFGVLKAVAYGWQQHAVAQNAEAVVKEGREFFDRLTKFMEHMGTLGEKLNDAVEAFNEAVGSAERRLMPTARRFQELGAGSKELNAVEPLECRARLPEKSGEKE